MSDMRDYYKFYGVHMNDWITSWGGQTYNKHLLKDYFGEGDIVTSTPSSTWTSSGRSFLYPHNIKKDYVLEGVIVGEITFGSNVASCVSDYRVSIFKLNTDTTPTTLASTSVVSAPHSMPAHQTVKYHFEILTSEPKQLNEYDRLGVKIEWNVNHTSSVTAKLQHENDATLNDLWVEIPLILGS